MFRSFTEEALDAIVYSQKEAERRNFQKCDSGMLLLGLLAAKYGIAFKALTAAGLSLNTGRAIVNSLVDTASSSNKFKPDWQTFPFSVSVISILDKAWQTAQKQEIKLIGTGQLLLEIINSKESAAFLALEKAEVDFEKLVELVTTMINEQSEFGEFIDGALPLNCAPANLKASLRISSDVLDPDEISNLLRVKPSQSFTKGARKLARKDFWSFSTEIIDSPDINDHLRWITNLIVEKSEELREIKDRGYKLRLICRFDTVHWNTTLSISTEILSILPAADLDLDLDIYYSDDDDEIALDTQNLTPHD